MRISDWSSDVCSSDLRDQELFVQRRPLRTDRCPHSAAVAFTTAEGEALMLYAQVHLTLPAWVHDAVDDTRTCATDEEKVALAIELSRRHRSEERRVGKECVSPCRTRCLLSHYKTKNTT